MYEHSLRKSVRTRNSTPFKAFEKLQSEIDMKNLIYLIKFSFYATILNLHRFTSLRNKSSNCFNTVTTQLITGIIYIKS